VVNIHKHLRKVQHTEELPYINLIGAVINRALIDYVLYSEEHKMLEKSWFQDARDFLFHGDRMLNFLEKYGMEEHINIEYIRNVAVKKKVNPDAKWMQGIQHD